jgi:sigma-E factor negative regulatory protein RseA
MTPLHDGDDVSPVPLALSMLRDGEAGDRQLDVALAAWSADAASRRAWQDWQLIGDVLRSEDLARSRCSDEAFLARLQPGLRAVAPDQPATARILRWPRWPALAGRRWAAAGLAAGLALTVGALALQPAGALVDHWLARLLPTLDDGGLVMKSADGPLIRDAQLDAYLRAHRAGAPTLPGGATGRFETVAIEK